MPLDLEAVGETLAGIVKTTLAAELAPLRAENDELKARIKALEERPLPEKGEPGEKGADGKDGADGRDGADGQSVTIDDVAPLVTAEVDKAVASLPVAKDGKDGRDGADGRDGKDAPGFAEVLKDDGELVIVLQDGTIRRTGIRDGEKGRDGIDGKDGRDGFGFDDLDVTVQDDDRTIELAFRRGDEEKVFTLKWPTVIYRGTYKQGTEYAAGDAVTWGGHMWIAEKDAPSGKPDQPDVGWRLAVKRGRDGKNANG